MRKVYIIVFNSENELLNGSEKNAECFTKSNDSVVYCGSWGEIQFNKTECLNSISSTINFFVQMPDKKEIYFGCNAKDVLDIKSFLELQNCELIEVSYCDFIKNFLS